MIRIIYNKDDNVVKSVKDALKKNGGYCPCATQKNRDTVCMCADFRKLTSGMCHCGLYEKIAIK